MSPRLLIFIFNVFFVSSICRAGNEQIPSPWAPLRPLEPNKETYVYLGGPKGKESSFSIQVHFLRDPRIQNLKEQFEKSKIPKNFGSLNVLGVETEEGCFQLSLGRARLIEEKQTWCFDSAKAYAAIEQGTWHLPKSFIKERLQKNGWTFPR